MNTSNPKEYVTLPMGGSNNYALHYDKTAGNRKQAQWTWFEKVIYRVTLKMDDDLKSNAPAVCYRRFCYSR